MWTRSSMIKFKSQEALNHFKQEKGSLQVKANDRGKRNIIQGLLWEYDIEAAEDIPGSKSNKTRTISALQKNVKNGKFQCI